jgi:hypothetical protein
MSTVRTLEDYTGKMRFLQASLSRNGTKDSLELKNVVLTSKLDDIAAAYDQIAQLRRGYGLGWEPSSTTRPSASLPTSPRRLASFIKNKDSLTTAYYGAKVQDTVAFQFTDTIRTKAELNDAFAFFRVADVRAPRIDHYFAKFDHGSLDELDVKIHSDSIGYQTYGFDRDSLYLSLIKDGSQNHFLGNAYVLIRDPWL